MPISIRGSILNINHRRSHVPMRRQIPEGASTGQLSGTAADKVRLIIDLKPCRRSAGDRHSLLLMLRAVEVIA
jgi:hypothetical protein